MRVELEGRGAQERRDGAVPLDELAQALDAVVALALRRLVGDEAVASRDDLGAHRAAPLRARSDLRELRGAGPPGEDIARGRGHGRGAPGKRSTETRSSSAS